MRAYKKPTPEGILTRQIRGILNAIGYVHYKAWQGLGSEKGVSDIIGLTRQGRFFAIEVKAPKGKLSPAQDEFLFRVNASGGIGIVARSVEDVIAALGLHGRIKT